MADGRLVPPGIFVSPGATLSIGAHFYMNAGATIEVRHDVHIGDHVLMGPFASIIDDDGHEVEPAAVRYKGRTVVGSNVWLGRNAAVMPGVTIGDGSVIGANSVVTRDIPPDSFAAGAPARGSGNSTSPADGCAASVRVSGEATPERGRVRLRSEIK